MSAPNQVDVWCPHCGGAVGVPASMRGGVANCPRCRRAIDVPGGVDLLYWGLVGLGIFAVALIAGLTALLASLVAGGIVLVAGLLVVLAVVLAS